MDSPGVQATSSPARPRSSTTRSTLIRATIDLLATSGAAALTTRAVAERAGLPHGTVSYHFRGKKELVREAVVRALTEMFTPMLSETVTIDSPTQVGEWLTEWTADTTDPRHLSLFVESIGIAQHDPPLRDSFAAMLRSARARVDAALVDSPVPAALVLAAADGALLHAAADPDFDLAATLATLAGLISKGNQPQ